jgi:hypothetical protein
MRPYAKTVQAQAKPVGISPTNSTVIPLYTHCKPPVIPLYTPSIPPVVPLYCNRGGLQGDYRGTTGGLQGDYRGTTGGLQGDYRGYRGGVEGGIARPMDTQPACGNRGWQGIDPGFRLPPTNICGHFLRKAPFCWALSKRHSPRTLLHSRQIRELSGDLAQYQDDAADGARAWTLAAAGRR